MPILNKYDALVVYDDTQVTNNPSLRMVDWRRNVTNFSVDNPLNQKFVVQPGASQTVFSGTRTTTIDNTTLFNVSINSTNNNLYRFSYAFGTTPGFRTDRGLAFNGDTVTITVNNNVSSTFNLTTNNWSAVSVGDTLFLPGTGTGDTVSPFNPLNIGYWVIIGKDSGGTPKNIQVTRLAGQPFSGISETQVLTSNSQIDVFSSNGIQIGDTVEISAGFSSVTQKAYVVSTVTANRIEVISTSPLPIESNISPTNSGMVFYSQSKRFVRIEADQVCYVQFNGDTGQGVRIVPQITSDIINGFGYLEKLGNAFSIIITNKSPSNICNVIFISAA